MKSEFLLLTIFILNNVSARNPSASSLVFNSVRACAHKHNLDMGKLSDIYMKGNFTDIEDDKKRILKCVADDLKLFINKQPQYHTIMHFVDFLIKGDKSGVLQQIEKCIGPTINHNFCQHLHNAFECFYHATNGFGRHSENKNSTHIDEK